MRYEEGAIVSPAADWLADFKTYARITFTGHDALLTTHLDSAREWFEQKTRILTIERTLTLHLDGFPAAAVIEVDRTPVLSITQIDYLDAAGASQTVANTDYDVDVGDDRTAARIKPVLGTTWPVTAVNFDVVQIVMQAGYTDIADLPVRYRDPIFSYALDLYNNVPGPSVRTKMLLEAAQRSVAIA